MLSHTKYKYIYLGVFLSFSLILSYIESLIPLGISLPGFKIGLSNLGVLITLIFFGPGYALMIAILKSLISSLLFGSITSLMYSLSGAVLSALIMGLLYKTKKVSIPVISAAGGVIHNLAQIIVAYFLLGTSAVFYYLPLLMIAGLLMGLLLGFLILAIRPSLIKIIHRGDLN